MKKMFVFALLFTRMLHAQQSVTTYAIVINCTCDDAVGKLYAMGLRDAIAASPRYHEATAEQIKAQEYLEIHAVSMDMDTDNKGIWAAIGYSFLIGSKVFLRSGVMTCGSRKASMCSTNTLANLDSVVADIMASK